MEEVLGCSWLQYSWQEQQLPAEPHQVRDARWPPPSCGVALQITACNSSAFEIIPLFLRIKLNPDHSSEPVYGSVVPPPHARVIAAEGGADSGTGARVRGQDRRKPPLLPKPATWTRVAWWRTRGWHSHPLIFTFFTAYWFSLHEIIWLFLLNQRRAESLVFAVILISREQFFAAPVNRT